jgi:hypothetical protein
MKGQATLPQRKSKKSAAFLANWRNYVELNWKADPPKIGNLISGILHVILEDNAWWV